MLCTSVALCKWCVFASFFINKVNFLNDVGRVLTTKRFGLKNCFIESECECLSSALTIVLVCMCLCAVPLLCVESRWLCAFLKGVVSRALALFLRKKKIWTLTLIDRSNGQKHLWKPCVQMFLCQFVLTLTYTFRTASCRTCMWTNDEDLEVVKKLHSFILNTTTKNNTTTNKWILKIVIILILLIIL